MRNCFVIYIFILKVLFILAGCTETTEREPPQTPSNMLNELVRSAPFQYLNLDKLQVQEINLSEDDIVYNMKHGVTSDEPLLGHLTRYTKVDNNFFVYDIEYNAIFKIDISGTVSGPLTREGRGPGEHITVENLKSNSKYIYAFDPYNARINRYTHDIVSAGILSGIKSFTDVNEETILSVNENSIGIAPVNPDQGLIIVNSRDDLTDTLATIMPRIIPAGYQPQIFNTPGASINHQNIIATNYYFLPWFFLFDEDYDHIRTIILEYSTFDEMDIPPMDFFKNLSNEGFGGVRPITEFKLMDNGDIFFSICRELIHLTRKKNGTYEVAGKFQFEISGEEEPLWISDIFPSDNENEFFIGSWYYLFQFTLSE